MQDVPIYTKPDVDSDVIATRKGGMLLECSETLVPQNSLFTFVKLRHDDGWTTMNTTVSSPEVSVAQLQMIVGEANSEEKTQFYKVLNAVAVRASPDMEGPKLAGVAPKPAGAIVGSSRRYTPPTGITYVKLMHEHGWIFEATPDGTDVLEKLTVESQREEGLFYYRAMTTIPVYSSPELPRRKLRDIAAKTFFAVDVQFTLPNDEFPHYRLRGEKAWISPRNVQSGQENVLHVSGKALF